MTAPSDRSLLLKEYEKISEYKDLEIEIQNIWHLEAKVMSAAVGALGVIKKKTEDHIKRIPGTLVCKNCERQHGIYGDFSYQCD